MDGTCAKTLSDFTKPSDFTMGELPMDRVEWTGNLMKDHPLCDMPAEFVNTTLTMHHKESSQHKMFISFDGRGDVTALRNMGAVFSTVLDDASDSGRLMSFYRSIVVAIAVAIGAIGAINNQLPYWTHLLISLILSIPCLCRQTLQMAHFHAPLVTRLHPQPPSQTRHQHYQQCCLTLSLHQCTTIRTIGRQKVPRFVFIDSWRFLCTQSVEYFFMASVCRTCVFRYVVKTCKYQKTKTIVFSLY